VVEKTSQRFFLVWRYPELRYLVDREGTPLHGVIYVVLLPSAAAWGVLREWGL